jgi:hypothetical protein
VYKPWLDSFNCKIDKILNPETVSRVWEALLDHEHFGLRAIKRIFDKNILGREIIDQSTD